MFNYSYKIDKIRFFTRRQGLSSKTCNTKLSVSPTRHLEFYLELAIQFSEEELVPQSHNCEYSQYASTA